MRVIKTARVKIKNYTRYLDYTVDKYREALEYVNKIVYSEWINVEQLDKAKERVNYIERLIHSTSKNTAVYEEFDIRFYKLPAYFRRMVISEAIGNVSSHMTRYKRWEDRNRERIASGRRPWDKPPTIRFKCNAFPVFYKDGMSRWLSTGKVALKLYNGSDWIWFILPVKPVEKNRFSESEGWVRKNPMLVKKGRRWSLHCPFEKSIELENKDYTRPVLSIDLGLNHTAVCSVVYPDGTVTHREFLSYEGEKDRLDTMLGKIAGKYRQTWLVPEGQKFANRCWRKVSYLAEEISHQCSQRIVAIAERHGCQTIVYEHLGKLKVPKSFRGARKLRKKLHYWMQGRIQKYTRYKAHSKGIRFSRVLARGTSKYAYDGSGEVIRAGNKQCAVFASGKTYNADLSASYNIGARYWIREYIKERRFSKNLAGNCEVAVEGERPCAVGRHRQTLASLISLLRSISHGDNTSGGLYSSQGFSVSGGGSASGGKETATITATAV